jgi:catalase
MPLTTDERLLALSREVIEVFDKANGGVHPGFRPAHAKGILLTGMFTPLSEAASLTRAPHLHRNSTPVTVRFSNFAGIPAVADNDPQGAGPRGFAVRFHLGEHIHTDIIGHSVDNFPARTAEGLLEFLNALIATDPAGPHPNAIEQFLSAHPAAATFAQIPKPIPTSFARESFFAVSAFKFTNADGTSRYGRYRVAGSRQRISRRGRSRRAESEFPLRRDQGARCKGTRQVSRNRTIGRGRRYR